MVDQEYPLSSERLIVDVETVRPVRPKWRPDAPVIEIIGIEYADSWTDWAGMGVAYIGIGTRGANGWNEAIGRNTVTPVKFTAWGAISAPYLIFGVDGDELHAIYSSYLSRRFARAQCVATFNGVKFDAPLLAAHEITIPSENHYDILREAWIAHGLDPDHYAPETHSGHGLDDYARVNIGMRKTGNGHNAAVLWQQGRRAEVRNYCNNDVALTAALFDLVVANGGLISPKTGEFVSMRKP